MTLTIIITALTLGIAGSLHCVGMCGPIVLSLPMVKGKATGAGLSTFNYFFGKTLSYGLLGLLFGLVGQQLVMAGFQRSLSIVLGLAMLVYALLAIFRPAILHHNPLTNYIGKKLQPVMGHQLRNPGAFSTLLLGFLNGFLPCGLVYIALGAAVAIGNSFYSALFMMIFGMATMPALLLLAIFNNKLSASYRSKIRQVLPYFSAVLAVLLIMRGLDLGIPFLSPQIPSAMPSAAGSQPVICH